MTHDKSIKDGVKRYLDAVAARLGSLTPAEREETLRDVESHIYDALAARGDERATPADLQAVLAEMDPPEAYGTPAKEGLRGLGQGKWALLISVGGVAAAAVLVVLGGGRMVTWPPVFLFLAAQISAFILGILSWQNSFGKAAVFTSAAMTVVALVFCS